MDRNLEVDILEIQGYHPISGTDRSENRLGSLHVEMGDVHPAVEAQEVDHWVPPTSDLGSDKETAVEAWGRRRKLDCFLLLQRQELAHGWNWGCSSAEGAEQVREGVVNERGPIPRAENLYHPGIGTPRLPNLPTHS